MTTTDETSRTTRHWTVFVRAQAARQFPVLPFIVLGETGRMGQVRAAHYDGDGESRLLEDAYNCFHEMVEGFLGTLAQDTIRCQEVKDQGLPTLSDLRDLDSRTSARVSECKAITREALHGISIAMLFGAEGTTEALQQLEGSVQKMAAAFDAAGNSVKDCNGKERVSVGLLFHTVAQTTLHEHVCLADSTYLQLLSTA